MYFKEIRRRFRYLRHLPLTCEFVICELELKPPIVSLDTLNFFKSKSFFIIPFCAVKISNFSFSLMCARENGKHAYYRIITTQFSQLFVFYVYVHEIVLTPQYKEMLSLRILFISHQMTCGSVVYDG